MLFVLRFAGTGFAFGKGESLNSNRISLDTIVNRGLIIVASFRIQNNHSTDVAGCSTARKAYSISFKIKAVDAVNSGSSKKSVTKKLGIDRHLIQEWRQQKKELDKLVKSKK